MIYKKKRKKRKGQIEKGKWKKKYWQKNEEMSELNNERTNEKINKIKKRNYFHCYQLLYFFSAAARSFFQFSISYDIEIFCERNKKSPRCRSG